MSYLFHGQRSNESVVLICKPHPFTLLHPMLVSGVILLVPLLFYVFLPIGPLLGGITALCAVIAVVHAFLAWFGWSNSVMLLTNERVVVLQQKHMLHREFSEVSLRGMQQVSHEVKGLYHTLLGYGTITIQTNGSATPFLIPNISNPYDVQQEILRVAAGEGFAEEAA